MRKSDSVRVQHMLDSARLAIKLSSQRSRADLDDDVMLRLSLVKLVEIVGEAARQVTAGRARGFPGGALGGRRWHKEPAGARLL